MLAITSIDCTSAAFAELSAEILRAGKMRVLSGLVVLRSRWNLDRRKGFALAGRLARKLPGLSRYLV